MRMGAFRSDEPVLRERVEALATEKRALDERLRGIERESRPLRRRARHPALRALLSVPGVLALVAAFALGAAVVGVHAREKERARLAHEASGCSGNGRTLLW